MEMCLKTRTHVLHPRPSPVQFDTHTHTYTHARSEADLHTMQPRTHLNDSPVYAQEEQCAKHSHGVCPRHEEGEVAQDEGTHAHSKGHTWAVPVCIESV